MRNESEIFAQYPTDGATQPLGSVRSTLLCSGITELRRRDLFDRYVEKLEPAAREVLLNAIAGVWLSIDVAMQHFGAIDALGLSSDEAFDIGAASGKRVQQSVLQTLVRLASGAGTNPWTVLEVYGRLWPRIMNGGGFTIHRIGPKDAILEYRKMPPCRFAYFRDAFRGVNHVGLGLFSRSMYVSEVPKERTPDGMKLHCSWV